ncbi:hypothetical protein PLESTB_001095500 [Pleodorina starrii]|uniref:Uncharacterized protein n=1 Tax=Pleodorina starrii TaxID=330485 RepID=A0A9W6F4Q0_9CHLO|nr:hypothetical protein PLESTM_000692400 [Pleodorina starrii]GLC56352.1 hypothetical protein PLESTB_001095500 [Pleodorina starrii]
MNQSYVLFDPSSSSSGSGDHHHHHLQLSAEHLPTHVHPIGSCAAPYTHFPEPLLRSSLPRASAASNPDGSSMAAEPRAWAAQPCSLGSDGETSAPPCKGVQHQPAYSRLVDCYQLAAGPLGPAASLPVQGAQAPAGLTSLCKALSSPPAYSAREASLANPAPRGGDGSEGRAAGRRRAASTEVSGLSAAFDAARAIAAFERSTLWAAALLGDGPDGRIGGSRLDCQQAFEVL